MESSHCQQAVTFFFWSSTYSWPGPLTLWPAPPPLTGEEHRTINTHNVSIENYSIYVSIIATVKLEMKSTVTETIPTSMKSNRRNK